eukprot:TRINITY_DN27714_c0_g1_i1.p1 TRINITY_DN27714_c0_g1~~TRINITY_DN27714_c0_g1_i1.p1  ORF type:complete len:2367 (+),score=544.21 TRINITY_DN27714_c0_g1_i1:922-7101(+)
MAVKLLSWVGTIYFVFNAIKGDRNRGREGNEEEEAGKMKQELSTAERVAAEAAAMQKKASKRASRLSTAMRNQKKAAQPAHKEEADDGLVKSLSVRAMALLGTEGAGYTKVRPGTAEADEQEDDSAKLGSAQILFEAMFRLECVVHLMQTTTLGILCCLAHDMMPSPVCALWLIFMSMFTLMWMNFATMKDETAKIIQEQKETFASMVIKAQDHLDKVKSWLAGDNILEIQFYVFQRKAKSAIRAKKVFLTVPELGLNFSGVPKIDRLLTPEEQAQMELVKKVIPYVGGQGRKAITDHTTRYYGDVLNTLCIALDKEQLMMRKSIDPVVATIQCANHLSAEADKENVSKLDHDSFLTLFKPRDFDLNNVICKCGRPFGGLEERFCLKTDCGLPRSEALAKCEEDLLKKWEKEVADWMKGTLGAVESEETDTTKIQEAIKNLLRAECTNSILRDVYRVHLTSLELPVERQGLLSGLKWIGDLTGKTGYVVVMYNNENVTNQFPIARASAAGRFEEHKHGDRGKRWLLKLDCDVMVPVDPGVQSIRFAVWAQDKEHPILLGPVEELVAYSDEVPLDKKKNEDSEPPADNVSRSTSETTDRDIHLHTHFLLKGPRGIEPLHDEDEDEEENMTATDTTVSARGSENVSARASKNGEGSPAVGRKSSRQSIKKQKKPPATTTAEKVREFFSGVRNRLALLAKGQHIAGHLKCTIEKGDITDRERDKEDILMLIDITQGATIMDEKKVVRHTDRWLDLARIFGLKPDEETIKMIDAHVKMMDKMKKDFETKEDLSERQLLIKKYDMRQTLADPQLLTTTIEDLKRKIAAVRAKQADENAVDFAPRPEVLLGSINGHPFFSPKAKREAKLSGLSMPTTPGSLSSCCGGSSQANASVMNFEKQLMSCLADYQDEQEIQSRHILHYVFLSEHIKPGNFWTPDPIPAHVANILHAQVETDKRKLNVCGLWEQEVLFEMVDMKKATPDQPLMQYKQTVTCNGRPVFQASKKATERSTSSLRERSISSVTSSFSLPWPKRDDGPQTFYLYWDGKCRWVISPKLGEPPPYGQPGTAQDIDHSTSEVGRVDTTVMLHECFWVKDHARQPQDIVDGEWKKYDKKSSKWVSADIKIFAINEGHQETAMAQDPNGGDEGAELFTEALEATGQAVEGIVGELFEGDDRGNIELQDCLVSMTATALEVAWRDPHIEELAPFRRFLLERFTTYEAAWWYITRNVCIPCDEIQQNLKLLLKDGITDEEAVKQEAAARRSVKGAAASRKSLKANLDSADSMAKQVINHIVVKERMQNYKSIHAQELQKLCDLSEDLPDGSPEPVQKLRDCLKKNKDFQSGGNIYNKNRAWLAVTNGYKICMEDFVQATYAFMRNFVVMNMLDVEPEERARRVYATLDIEMCDGIRYEELVPASGSTWKDADRSLRKFRVPLKHLEKVIVDKEGKKFGPDKKQMVKVRVFDNHKKDKEWMELQQSLDPSWQADMRDSTRELQVLMRSELIQLWHVVTHMSGMGSQRIYEYTGAFKEHPILSNTFLRHGTGQQKWLDVRDKKEVTFRYVGEWHHHLYEGKGDLYVGSVTDNKPIYRGGWMRGKRHGKGILPLTQGKKNVEGDILEFMYEGEFKDDLMNGQGVISLVSRTRMRRSTRIGGGVREEDRMSLEFIDWEDPEDQSEQGDDDEEGAQDHAMASVNSFRRKVEPELTKKLIPSKLALKHLREFKTEFKTEAAEAHRVLLNEDPAYKKAWPEPPQEEPALEKVDNKYCLEYTNYLAVDEAGEHKVQKDVLLPRDLGGRYYRRPNCLFDIIKNGTAMYDDNSEYTGEFHNGVPHGRGTLKQYEYIEGEDRLISKYDGKWQNGHRHGEGTHEIYQNARGKGYEPSDDIASSYTGQWKMQERDGYGEYKNKDGETYKGQFKEGWFHGTGELANKAEDERRYVGEFVKGLRHGKGSTYWHNSNDEEQIQHKGEYQNDLRHGEGVFHWRNGQEYHGQFEKGRRAGKGKFLLRDPDEPQNDEKVKTFNVKQKDDQEPSTGNKSTRKGHLMISWQDEVASWKVADGDLQLTPEKKKT